MTVALAPQGRLRVLHLITNLRAGGSLDNTLVTVEGLRRVRYEVDLAAGSLPANQNYTDWTDRARQNADALILLPDLCHDVSGKNRRSICRDRRALRFVLSIVKPRTGSGARLDDHVHSRFYQLGDVRWNQGDSLFAGKCLFGDGDLHRSAQLLVEMGGTNWRHCCSAAPLVKVCLS